MKHNNLVSIIIPSYNQAQYLEASVQSALTQTYSNTEIIIINDGSTDNTEEVANHLQSRYPEKIKFISQENTGVSIARNNAIQQSQGKYILPLDADDQIDKEMITKCMQILIETEVDIISTDAQTFGEKIYKITPLEFPDCNLLYANCWIGASLYRREVWAKTGGYKQNMSEGYEDWEFWVNAYKHGFKFKRFPEVLFLYRTKKISRDIAARNKALYLKSKITLNHPELYTVNKVQKSIKLIREYEKLPDIYFYTSKNIEHNNPSLVHTIETYLSSNQLQKDQLLSSLDNSHKIRLFALNEIKNEKHVEELFSESHSQYTVFYGALRYDTPFLKTLDFTWNTNEGIVDIAGTTFPLLFKDIRENEKTQLIAHQREIQYLTTLIEQQANMIEKIKYTIGDTGKYSITKHPIKKYKAYKSLLKQYGKYKTND